MCLYNMPPYKSYMPSSNGSLVITIKPKVKCKFRETTMFLFYILQEVTLNNLNTFLKSTTTLSSVSDAATFEFRMATCYHSYQEVGKYEVGWRLVA